MNGGSVATRTAKTTAAKTTAAKAPARKTAAAPARKLPAKKAALAAPAPATRAQTAQAQRRLRPAVPLTHSEQEPDQESTVHEGEVLPPAPGRKATGAKAAAAQPPPEQRPDTDGDDKTEQAATATVTFHGRPMLVRVPEPEQIVIYQRVAAQFQERTAKGPIGGPEAVALYDRALKVITSLIIHHDDVVYIEDLLLERKTNLAGCTPILTDAVSALREANPHLNANRETRRERAKVSRKA